MVFDGIKFIKPDIEFDKDCLSYAPRFRKKFFVGDAKNAKLYVCGLGIGYFYINGKRVSDDLFTAPFSDYRKTSSESYIGRSGKISRIRFQHLRSCR